MKGFFEWFRSSSKMKRWIFLILLGTISICFSISKILVTNKLESIADIAIIICGFVLGFLAMIIGLVYMNKRTLELLVKETDKREETNVKSLIFNRKVYSQGPKIVVIGGGTGLNYVLKGLKKYTDNLTAIVTVSDYGETSSDSRKLLKTLPLEDIKESLTALSTNEDEMNSLLNYKFQDGKLQSLSFGDIYLLAMQHVYKDFAKSVKQCSEVLNITGKVLPVSMEEMKICAELEDGTVVENRTEIPEIVNKKASRINRIFVNPTNCKAAPGVIQAIEEADAVIIGPGNLYTNVIPNLLVTGVARAMKHCKGFKIYISNIMTEPGQTYEYSLSDHIKAIVDHVGEGVVDYCIYDTGEIVPEIIRKYSEEGKEPVEQDTAKAKAMGVHLMKRDLATIDGEYIRHNPDAIAASIVELICEDLKFRDMQNNPEYMILNNTLKTKKKKLKERKSHKVGKLNILDENKKNRFSNKYEERIKSIKESEKKPKQKNISKESNIRRNKNSSDLKDNVENIIADMKNFSMIKKNIDVSDDKKDSEKTISKKTENVDKDSEKKTTKSSAKVVKSSSTATKTTTKTTNKETTAKAPAKRGRPRKSEVEEKEKKEFLESIRKENKE